MCGRLPAVRTKALNPDGPKEIRVAIEHGDNDRATVFNDVLDGIDTLPSIRAGADDPDN